MQLLTMAIPHVEILAVRLFTVYFNVFVRGHQRRCSRGGEFEGIESV